MILGDLKLSIIIDLGDLFLNPKFEVLKFESLRLMNFSFFGFDTV